MRLKAGKGVAIGVAIGNNLEKLSASRTRRHSAHEHPPNERV